jgi:hypothetical protein
MSDAGAGTRHDATACPLEAYRKTRKTFANKSFVPAGFSLFYN